MKIIIVGTFPGAIGGVTVSNLEMAEALSTIESLDVIKFDFNKVKFNKILSVFKLIIQVIRSDIILMCLTEKGVNYYSWPFLFLAKCLNKKTILRKYGGGFLYSYEKYGFFNKWISLKSLKSFDLVLFETKKNINYFERLGLMSEHLPNFRKIPSGYEDFNRENRDGFLYLGSLNKSKGIEDIFLAASNNNNQNFYIYGERNLYYIDLEKKYNLDNVIFMGACEPSEVPSVVNRHKFFLFPTRHHGEGYPGAIISALSVGVPVISRDWQSMPEIINRHTGFLFKENPDFSINKAISMNDEQYIKLSNECTDFFLNNLSQAACLTKLRNWLVKI